MALVTGVLLRVYRSWVLTRGASGWLLFAFLLVVRFLFGGFQAGGFPALARVVADWIPSRQRGFAQGMVWTFSRLGGFAAPLLVLWLIWGFGGWETPLWLLASTLVGPNKRAPWDRLTDTIVRYRPR